MITYTTNAIIVLIAIVILITSIGILRTTNTLQKLHFTTIIDTICFPLLFLTIMLTLGSHHTKLFYGMIIVTILAPIAAYFMGKLYYTLYKHQLKPEIDTTINNSQSV